jgi:hypothetical protein
MMDTAETAKTTFSAIMFANKIAILFVNKIACAIS